MAPFMHHICLVRTKRSKLRFWGSLSGGAAALGMLLMGGCMQTLQSEGEWESEKGNPLPPVAGGGESTDSYLRTWVGDSDHLNTPKTLTEKYSLEGSQHAKLEEAEKKTLDASVKTMQHYIDSWASFMNAYARKDLILAEYSSDYLSSVIEEQKALGVEFETATVGQAVSCSLIVSQIKSAKLKVTQNIIGKNMSFAFYATQKICEMSQLKSIWSTMTKGGAVSQQKCDTSSQTWSSQSQAKEYADCIARVQQNPVAIEN